MYSTEHSLNKRLVCNGQLVILAEYGHNAIFREMLDSYGTSVSLDKVALWLSLHKWYYLCRGLVKLICG
jgi:hypothetical protein